MLYGKLENKFIKYGILNDQKTETVPGVNLKQKKS